MECYNNDSSQTPEASTSKPPLEIHECQISNSPNFKEKLNLETIMGRSQIKLPSNFNDMITKQNNDNYTSYLEHYNETNCSVMVTSKTMSIHSKSKIPTDSASISKSELPVLPVAFVVDTLNTKTLVTSVNYEGIQSEPKTGLNQLPNITINPSQARQNVKANDSLISTKNIIKNNGTSNEMQNKKYASDQSTSAKLLQNKLYKWPRIMDRANTTTADTTNNDNNVISRESNIHHTVTKVNNSITNNMYITATTKVNQTVRNNENHLAMKNTDDKIVNIIDIPNRFEDDAKHNTKAHDCSNITRKSKEKENIRIQYNSHMTDQIVPPRAVAVLPCSLHFYKNAVYPRRILPPWTRFGPVKGVEKILSPPQVKKVLSIYALDTPIFFVKNGSYEAVNIDVSDADKSNWFNLLSLGDASSANVCIYEEDGELYGITLRRISPRTPLMLCYSKQYATMYGLRGLVVDLELENSKSRQWCCRFCEKDFPSADLYVRHKKLCLKANRLRIPKKYRCRHCSHTFTRLFTLRRHTKVCVNKNNNTNTKIEQSATALQNSTPSLDESKIPSDESFQNINVEFSTNLFDTDRIPNFDMSSSKSDCDFNNIPGYKDESFDLEFTKFVKGLEHGSDLGKADEIQKNRCVAKSKRIPKCTFCEVQHSKPCPRTTKSYVCKCKKVFTKKLDYEKHSCSHRSSMTGIKTDTSVVSKFQCEVCQLVFKRRGMLVNHLWKVHGREVETAIEKRVRHYPCAVCPKVYLAANKRDSHMASCHPEYTGERPGFLLGGKISTKAAQCSLCPRQYATRAKMLQHMRRHHPDKAPPIQKVSKKKT